MTPNPIYPCPACGFQVFDSPPGSYDICPVCGWEDDDVQLRYPLMGGGANKRCLAEQQSENLKSLPLTMTAHQQYRRDPSWRPVTRAECENTQGMPTSGREYFDAAGAVTPEYYWKKGMTP